jgi:hypothetical protein
LARKAQHFGDADARRAISLADFVDVGINAAQPKSERQGEQP